MDTGQMTVTTTATKISATTTVFPSGCAIHAEADNAGPIFLGDASVTTSTGYRLDPGEEYPPPGSNLTVSDLSTLYAVRASSLLGPFALSWIGQ
jgi:hypothetical protein